MDNSSIFLIQLLKTLDSRLNDTDNSSYDNTVIQFFEAPYDQVNLVVSAQSALLDPTAFKWGGSGVNPGWMWGQGRWG